MREIYRYFKVMMFSTKGKLETKCFWMSVHQILEKSQLLQELIVFSSDSPKWRGGANSPKSKNGCKMSHFHSAWLVLLLKVECSIILISLSFILSIACLETSKTNLTQMTSFGKVLLLWRWNLKNQMDAGSAQEDATLLLNQTLPLKYT